MGNEHHITVNSVLEEIKDERIRQVDKEGWTPEHDDDHDSGQMARAAAAYAWVSSLTDPQRSKQARLLGYPEDGNNTTINQLWPLGWARKWFKPKTPRNDLIRAAALIVAEIERLDRAAK